MTLETGTLNDEVLRTCRIPEADASFGALETPRGALPLEAMQLSGRILGLGFTNHLEQTFVNAYDEPLEATYIFPLPDRAAVHAFRLQVGERMVEGVLQERGQARRDYQVAIESGHRAAIAEEDRPGVFTMRAGNIPPGERVTVHLELAGPLDFADGEATFRFPLVVAPRFIPGTPLGGPDVGTGVAADTDATPDASRITPPLLLPGQPNPVRLGMRLEVDPAGLPLKALRSSLHALRTQPGAAADTWVVELAEGTERLDKDLILRLSVGESGVRTGLVTAADEGERAAGTLALTVVPPSLAEAGQTPRDVVVVLDRSGSMQGWKMAAARRAAARLLDSLTAHDRLAVLLFDNVVDALEVEGARLIPGSDRNRYRAVEFLSGAEARGGTQMSRALDAAVACFDADSSQRERVIVFVTDGQVGNEDQLLWQVRRQAAGVRVYALGIDRAVNEAFLKRLSRPTGGHYDLVESEDRLDEVMQAIHRRIGNPVLTDLRLEGGGLEVSPELTPAGPADVFPGAPLVLRGRYQGEPHEKLTLRGTLPDGDTWTQDLTPRPVNDEGVRLAWARSRVLDLEHEYVVSGERDPARAQALTEFSLAQGVLCRFTAFVAIDKEEVVNEGGEVRAVTQPVEPVEGWADAGAGAPGGAANSPCLAGGYGAGAGPMDGAGAMPMAPAPAAMAPPPSPAPRRTYARKKLSTGASKGGGGGALGSLGRGLLDTVKSASRSLGNLMGSKEEAEVRERMQMFSSMSADHECDEALAAPPPRDPRQAFQVAFSAAVQALRDQGLAEVRKASDEGSRRQALAYLVTDLEALLDRARPQGAHAEVVAELDALLGTLQRLLEGDELDGPGVEAALAELGAALGAAPVAAAEPEPPPRGESREFWK